jgi:hypothetical protein
MELTEIRVKIQTGEYRYSDHAVKQMIKLSMDRVRWGKA